MAQLPSQFNSQEHEDMNDFSPIPEGEYLAQIVKSEMKPTKDATGQYLNLQFKILNGKYKDRVVFTMLNLINKSSQAVEIAQRQLATICRAVGKVSITDSVELHGLPMTIVVGMTKGDAKYAPKNEIKMYKPADGAAPAPTSPQVAPVNASAAAQPEVATEQPAQEEPKKRPWE